MSSEINVCMEGNESVYIENYSQITDYDDKVVKLRGKKLCVRITGSRLCISSYTKTDMYIEGKIKSVEYYNEEGR